MNGGSDGDRQLILMVLLVIVVIMSGLGGPSEMDCDGGYWDGPRHNDMWVCP